MSGEIKSLLASAKSQVRLEKIQKFLVKKNTIRFALAAGVLLVSWIIFAMVQNAREAKFSEILHQSLIDQQLGDLEKSKESLQKIHNVKSAPSGVWALASLRLAGFELMTSNTEKAAEIYAKVNSCFSCDSYLKDLAGLLMVKVWMVNPEELKKDDLSARILKVENSAKSLRYYVAEQRALLEMQKNNLEKAYEIFALIAKSPEAAQSLKTRCEDEMQIVISKGYSPKVAVKVEAKKEEKKSTEAK
jgi:hypothetical protein